MTENETNPETPDSFDPLPLSDTMRAALEKAEYQSPTPVQAGVIPIAISGTDVVAQARTGTGKTAAFGIPILERLESHQANGPRAIILVPTRELAVQVRDEIAKLAHGRRITSIAVYGGKPIRGQIEKLQRGVDIVVGTPGRVLDHMTRGTLSFENLEIAVLDEADRMLDIGFRPDIEKILSRCPSERQTLLLSATVPPTVQRLSKRYMRNATALDYSPKDISAETIDQYYFTVSGDRKFGLLEKLIAREDPRQAIVFCRTKRGTDKTGLRLSKQFKKVATIHGDLAQSARDRVMKNFRAKEVKILVATDVIGRGIDVTGISHIINYDIPQFCDDYVHRVGRTGRMSTEGITEGVAYTFVTPEEGGELTRIEMRINLELKRDEIGGYESRSDTPKKAAVLAADGSVKAPATGPDTPVKKKKKKRYRRAL